MNQNDPTITIMGQEVSVTNDEIEIHQLRFLPSNPRVYAVIRDIPDFEALTNDEQQQHIYDALLQETSVRKLLPEIKKDQGLHEPITVRHDTMQVVDGNSRLAVYRKLHDTDSHNWAEKIQCRVVATLSKEQQTRLLGQIHLLGQTEWTRYAKALYCFRSINEEGQNIATLAKLSGLGSATIKKYIKTVELMRENNDDTPSHFSHYEVLIQTRKIHSSIDERPTLKGKLLSEVKRDHVTAQKLRDWLPKIIEKQKILKRYEEGKITLEDAYDRAKISDTEKRLKDIRDKLDDVEEPHLRPLNRNEVNAIQQVVKQIYRKLDRVSKMVDAKLASKTNLGT